MSDFLMIELGLVNSQNQQTPPSKIKEKMAVFGQSYELTASISGELGHFFTVVKWQGKFFILDSLPKLNENLTPVDPYAFSTFSAAVKNDTSVLSTIHETSAAHSGIHILLYHTLKEHSGNIIPLLEEEQYSKQATVEDVSNDEVIIGDICRDITLPKVNDPVIELSLSSHSATSTEERSQEVIDQSTDNLETSDTTPKSTSAPFLSYTEFAHRFKD